MSEMPQKNDDRITIRLPGDLLETLAEIKKRHGLGEAEIARRCLESVADFYRAHGFFAFPVKMEPEAGWLERAMEYRASISVDSPAARQTPEAKAREAKRKAS